MSTDAWEEIQAIKSKRNSLRERLEKRKKARQELLGSSLGSTSPSGIDPSTTSFTSHTTVRVKKEIKIEEKDDLVKLDPELERDLLRQLSEVTLQLPVVSSELLSSLKLYADSDSSHRKICNLLEKFAIQKLITGKSCPKDGVIVFEVTHVEVSKVNAMILDSSEGKNDIQKEDLKRKREDSPEKNSELDEDKRKKEKKEPKSDILSLLSMPSTKEKESKKLGEEILDLLSKPTAKERSLTERFKSQGGKQLMEFCPHGTRAECERNGSYIIILCAKLFLGMIERLSPGTKKIELFGRPHNIQPNWITLGNQVDGIRLVDPLLIENFRKRYPTGNCMAPPPENTHV
uniref:mRNA m(6)A methyltransferase n=1 Tax=Diabrotica virgifera virgifera TaxID=50390 RepID=A0A6P7G2P4_DIAVI